MKSTLDYEKHWGLGTKHELWGEVVAMGRTDGDCWRMFSKEGCTTLMPLDALQLSEEL